MPWVPAAVILFCLSLLLNPLSLETSGGPMSVALDMSERLILYSVLYSEDLADCATVYF